MDANGRDLAALLSVILLLVLNQPLANSTIVFFLRRSRRRWARVRCLQILEAVFLHFRVRRNDFGQWPRSAWVLPRLQNWFQRLLNDRALDWWWKENFRVSRCTFEYICRRVGPALQRQNTQMRDAVPVPKRVGASLWRLATGECYRSCGLMVGLAKPTVVNSCHDWICPGNFPAPRRIF